MAEYIVELGNYEPLTEYTHGEDTLDITARMNGYQNALFYIGNNIFNKQNVAGIEKVIVIKEAKVK